MYTREGDDTISTRVYQLVFMQVDFLWLNVPSTYIILPRFLVYEQAANTLHSI